MKTIYTPNFSEKRTIKRAHLALEFVEKFTRPHKPQWLYSKWIYHKDNFGSDRNQLSKYLKELLLICVNEKYCVGLTPEKSKCKEYITSEIGVRYLKEQLGLIPKRNHDESCDPTILIKHHTTTKPYCSVDLHPTFQKHLNEFLTGNFITKFQSDREWHDCIHLPSDIRSSEFTKVGYQYNSDIVCAAPTLLYQYAKKCGMNKDLMAIEYYINNRSHVRNRICDLLDMNTTPKERKTVKRILSGFFNGLYLTHRRDSQLVRDLEGKHVLIDRLQNDLYVTRLRQEITMMWTYIKKYNKSLGVNVKLNSSEKSRIYRRLENEVRDVVKRYMRKNNIYLFLEHDGWRTNKMYDVTELRSYIKSQIGYVIEIDWEVTEI